MHFIFTHFCELKNDPSTTFPYKSTEIHEAISSSDYFEDFTNTHEPVESTTIYIYVYSSVVTAQLLG